ncbi:MAG: DUF3127 domain-containing protein [Candidatus Kapabacteria bacterium]|nr:DUF3127 domain-containing protein [Candidatus Kapabacteria bacterium]
MAFEAIGKLHEVYPEQQVTEKFRKREFVLEMQDGMYQQYIKFQMTQDRCTALDGFNKGDDVKVSFNLTGRPSTTKNGDTVYYTNLNAWRIDRAEQRPKDVPDMRQPSVSDIDEVPF